MTEKLTAEELRWLRANTFPIAPKLVALVEENEKLLAEVEHLRAENERIKAAFNWMEEQTP